MSTVLDSLRRYSARASEQRVQKQAAAARSPHMGRRAKSCRGRPEVAEAMLFLRARMSDMR